MGTFAEVSRQVHLIKDLILSDMVYDNDFIAEEAVCFSKHLFASKLWFVRISWANKKRYILALLEDVRSAWTLSLLLKSIWNCRPKDAVISFSMPELWSSYDQVPMDHNRTALPLPSLVQVMKNDRKWFLTLDPEPQAMVLAELLTVSGGPLMWEVLRRAQIIYDRYRLQQLKNLQECTVVNDLSHDKARGSAKDAKGKKKEQPQAQPKETGTPTMHQSTARKQLDAHILAWNATIKSLKDSLKLEEVEMTFTDGTKKKIWKVNRPKPEAVETVDMVQLLPSAIGKYILSYVPLTQLSDCARVNKYWAFLVDEYRAELNARQKLNVEFNKIEELMLRHDTSMDVLHQSVLAVGPSSFGTSIAPSLKMKQPQPSVRISEKSAGAYSFRHFLSEKLNKPGVGIIQAPIRNLADLSERLERRGAIDENVWEWCEKLLRRTRNLKKTTKDPAEEGIISLGNINFPCPMMKQNLEIPLRPPLYKDPTARATVKIKRNISNATVLNFPREQENKRHKLWSRDFSTLYPVCKILSHQSPF